MKKIIIDEINYPTYWTALEHRYLPKYKGFARSRVDASFRNIDLMAILEVFDLEDSNIISNLTNKIIKHVNTPINYFKPNELKTLLLELIEEKENLNTSVFDEEIKAIDKVLKNISLDSSEFVQVIHKPIY